MLQLPAVRAVPVRHTINNVRRAFSLTPSVCADHGDFFFAPRHVGVCQAITVKSSQRQELCLHEPQSVFAFCRTAKNSNICQTRVSVPPVQAC